MRKRRGMILYLIRHGQTDYNKQGKLQGGTDIPLNDYGRELAHIAAKRVENVEFDLAITSPLSRARETARILLGSRNVAIIEDARIREISFGEFEGMCWKEDNYNLPDPDFMNFFQAPERYAIPPQGESFQSILERTGQFWKDLCNKEEYRDKTILISTHGCALKAILANINGTPLEKFWGDGCHRNCAITRVDVNKDGVRVTEDI